MLFARITESINFGSAIAEVEPFTIALGIMQYRTNCPH